MGALADLRPPFGEVGLGDLPAEADGASGRDPDPASSGSRRSRVRGGSSLPSETRPRPPDSRTCSIRLAVIVFREGPADAGDELVVAGHQAHHRRMAVAGLLRSSLSRRTKNQTALAARLVVAEGGHRLQVSAAGRRPGPA